MDIPSVYINTGSKRNRLTVAKKRITLKLREGVTEDEQLHLVVFAKMIAQRTLNIYNRTMRGCFSNDLQSIEMMNTNRSIFCLYCFDELEPEGFSNDLVGSNNATSRTKKTRWTGVGYGPVSGSGFYGSRDEDYWEGFVD